MIQTHYERQHLALVPKVRHTFATWQRDRQVQIIAELQALRADLARLQRQATQVARCHQCRVYSTITIGEDGNYRCKRCVAVLQEASA